MSIPGLAISLLLLLIAIAVVALPFWQSSRLRIAADANLRQQCDRVRSYYERVLMNIRDLDEDFLTGKMQEADYQEEREVWVHRGIRLLRVQDSLDKQGSLVDGAGGDAEAIDKAIEAAVQAIREGRQPVYHDLPGGGASG